MVDVSLACFVCIQTIQSLTFRDCTQCCYCQCLCLTSGEQCGTVNARQYINFCRQFSDFFDTTAVRTFVVSQDHSSNCHLLEFIDDISDQLRDVFFFTHHFCQLFCQGFCYFFCNSFDLRVSVLFQFSKYSVFHSGICDETCYQIVSIFRDYIFCVRSFFLTFFCCDFFDPFCNFQVCIECQMDRFHHQCIRDFVCASFDHHNLIFFGRYCQVQSCCFSLCCCRVYHQLTVTVTDVYGRNGICEGDIRDVQSQGSTNHSQHFGSAVLIYGHYCCNDRYVISVIFREQRTQRSIDTSCCQNSFFGRSAFSFDETAGDLTNGVQSFFVIDAQREEIDTVSGFIGCCCSYQNSCIAVTHQSCAVCLFCYSADFSCQCSASQFHGIASKHIHSPFLECRFSAP